MAEKKQDIKDGKNIELDDITVLNNVSVAEKAEVKEETKEISTEEVPSEEVKAESSEAEVAAAVEVPTEIPIVSGVASENSDIVPQIPVVEETNTFEIPTTDYNLNTQNPNEEENAQTYGPQLFGGELNNNNWQNNFQANVDIEPPKNNIFANDMNQAAVKNFDDKGNDLFSTLYNNDEVKVEATIVTEADAAKAKSANMRAYEELYDKGPGHQISILRNFSEEAAKWIKDIKQAGYVSGTMQEIGTKILNKYEGLRDDSFSADDDNKESQFNSNIIQFPQSNFNDGQNNDFDGNKFVA